MREILDKFIELLNKHNVPEISELFDSEISFMDMNGYSTSSRDEVSLGVAEYFKMFPDYNVQVLDIEEMMGSFKVIVQTYGTLSDENREQIKQAYGKVPTPEELHPPQLWKIGFHEEKISMWMMESIIDSKDPKHVALSFVWAINTGKAENVISRMANTLIQDVMGASETRKKEDWLKAWEGYYKLFPDYKVFPENIHMRGNEVIMLGYSDGTMSDFAKETLKHEDGTPKTKEELQGSAIWRAVVEDGKVSQWHVYYYNQASIDELELADYGYKPRY